MERHTKRSRSTALRLVLAAALAAGSALVPGTALAAWNGLAPGVGYTAEGNTYSVTITDVNRDGAPDVLAASESTNHVLVYLARGNGTLTAFSPVNVSSPVSLATGDLNGDGFPDLVVADAFDSTASVLLGHGDGSFSSPASFAVGSGGSHSPGTSVANAVALADLDGDGKLDIAVATVDGLGVLLGHGDGTFGVQSLHTATGSSCGVALADLNGDGKPDILAAVSGGFDVLLNAGGSGFSSPASFAAAGATCSILAADLNGDSKRDVVVGTSVLLGVGDGSFGAATTYPVAHGVDAGDAVADLDGDGVPDLVFAEGTTSSVAVRRGKGDGTFLAAQEFGIGTGINNLPLSMAVGDLDGDGLPDAVTGGTGSGGPSAEVSVLLNAGPAPAQAPPAMTFTPNARADIHEGDNNQNEPQVAVDQTGTSYITWQSNTGPPAQPPGISSTTEGVTFTALPNPDPNGVNPINGDVDVATTTWPNLLHTPTVSGSGDNGVFAGKLAQGSCGAIEIRDAVSRTQGATWTPADASCAPTQVDRPWIAAYTPPSFRGTPNAVSNTLVFNEYHDLGSSEIFVTRSTNGGASYDSVQYDAIQPSSVAQLTTTCNTIPSGVAVDQNGAHRGRVYVLWETSDLPTNATQGCNVTQAEAFDHIFLSYSDDISSPSTTVPTWTSTTVFNDPCAPSPPTPPLPTASCQDLSELFNNLAVDDAGNVYAGYIFRDLSQSSPEYDAYVSVSSDGGTTFTRHKANTDTGTHYMPWLAAGGDGGVDMVFYRTATVVGAAQFGKPAAAPATAVWDVWLTQSLDTAQTWTESKVSDATDSTGGVYFGDICSTGIFCGNGSAFGWGDDRILFDDFGVAIGPDGGARIAWTDARDTHAGACVTGGTVSCQASTHVRFACQTSGRGLHREVITGCGQTAPTAVVPEARWAVTLLLAGGAVYAITAAARRRGSRRRLATL